MLMPPGPQKNQQNTRVRKMFMSVAPRAENETQISRRKQRARPRAVCELLPSATHGVLFDIQNNSKSRHMGPALVASLSTHANLVSPPSQ